MFTGIVEAVGRVAAVGDGRLEIARGGAWPGEEIAEGESVAVDGVCLTVVGDAAETLRFDVSPETLARSALGDRAPGDPVNLERAMRADGRFGGHLVSGHVDATGRVSGVREEGGFVVMSFEVPPGFGRYLVDKGSVAVDGVSLTVVRPGDASFEVWLVPHTLSVTTLGGRRVGDRVDLEFDQVAKYVERLLRG